MKWLALNWTWVVSLAGQHLAVALPAILLSLLIAVPIGRLAFKSPRAGGALLSVTSLLYAIPSLPLIIVIPILFGTPLRSRTTMIIALTIYGVALLVRSAADAFGKVDPEVREAARAVGYSELQLFWRVDLPLAVPVLTSGLRVVCMSTIAMVTIGALVGISSLGTLLTDGFQRSIAGEVLTGILGTALLAILLDLIVAGIGRALTPWTRASTDEQAGGAR